MGEAKRTNECSFHQPVYRRCDFDFRPVYWMANVPPDPVSGVVFCGCGGNLAILRAASVPRGVLGTQRRVGAAARRHGRLFILQIACCAKVVFRQHWLSPRPPSEPQNPQLPSEEVLRSCSAAASQAAAHNREQSFLYSAENVGCEETENGRFSLKWSVLTEKSDLAEHVAMGHNRTIHWSGRGIQPTLLGQPNRPRHSIQPLDLNTN